MTKHETLINRNWIHIYYKPHRLKRGHRLTSVPPDSTFQDCLRAVQEASDILDSCQLTRAWVKDGETIVDYGPHNAYIIIKADVMTRKEGQA